jgi:hypothetical protein
MSLKNSDDIIGNRTHDLPACSVVPQPTAPPRDPFIRQCILYVQMNTYMFRYKLGYIQALLQFSIWHGILWNSTLETFAIFNSASVCNWQHTELRKEWNSASTTSCVPMAWYLRHGQLQIDLCIFVKEVPYFPAIFFPRKMWPKFDLRLMRRG